MADDLPPGFKLDAPAPKGGANDLPPGFKLDEPAKPDPASFQQLLGHPKEGVTGNKETPDNRSETEKRLTADALRALLNARGQRETTDLITGEKGQTGGSYTERMIDWLIPGAKNVMGGAFSLGKGLVTGDGTLGENWRAGVNAEKQFREQNRSDTAGPLGYAADAAGIIGSGGRAGPSMTAGAAGVGAPTITTGTKAGSSVLNAAKTQGTMGAISGAAENSQSWGDAGAGAVVGGATGAGTGAVVQGLVGRLLANKAAAAERQAMRGPSPDDEFARAGAKFKELDKAGIQYDQGQARRMGGMLPQVLKDANYTATSAPELSDALRAVYAAGGKNAPPLTFTELQALRGKVSDAANANPANANLRRIASRVTGMIDDFVEKNQPNINQSGADLAKLWSEGRRAFRTGVLGETITDIEGIAANKAATSASNASDLERKAVAAQANKDIKSGHTQLNPAAQEARQAVIEGSPKLEAVARATKSWPVQAGIALGSGAAGGAMGFPNTGMLGSSVIGPGLAYGAGRVAKHFADKNTANSMDDLVRAIMTGSADAPSSWEMERNMLARLLATRGTQTAAGQGAAGTVAAKRRKEYEE